MPNRVTGETPRVAITSRFPVSQPGGVESVVRELLPRLRMRRPAWSIDNVWAFGRPTALNRLPLLGDLVAAIGLALKVRKYDAVVVNGAEYAWPQLLMPRRTLVVWHGTREHETPALHPVMSPMLRTYLIVERFLQGLTRHIPRHIAVGGQVLEEVREAIGPRCTITLAVNGAPRIASGGDRSPIPGRVLWIGTTRYKKGLDRAIAVLETVRQRLPHAHLHAAGLAASENEPSFARMLGRLSTEEMTLEYRSAEVVLMTTRYEGCSIAVLEAMAHDVPVVGSSAIAWMLPEPCDADQAMQVETLLRRPDAASEAVAKQRERLKAFDWERSADVYAAEIEELLAVRCG